MQDDRLTSSLPHAVVRLFRLVNRAHNRALGPVGVSAEQAHVLSILWEIGPVTVGELQRLLALSSPTLTGAIDRMEAQRLVQRVRSPRDRRVQVLEPDLRAHRWRRKIWAILDRTERECFAGLTKAERRELLRLLDKATAALDRDEK